MDGMRLQRIQETNCTDGGEEFRLEANSTAKICAYGRTLHGYSHFSVWHKNGRRHDYGTSSATKVAVPTASGEQTLAWALGRVEDRLGNYIIYEYQRAGETLPLEDWTDLYSPDTGSALVLAVNGPVLLPKAIRYTGWTDGSSEMLPERRIEFNVERRPDFIWGLYKSVYTATAYRVTGISMHAPGGQVDHYRLSYDNGGTSKRSRLATIDRCAGDGTTCVPETIFDYQKGKEVLGSSDVPSLTEMPAGQMNNPLGVPSDKAFISDLDGDGNAELVTASGTFEARGEGFSGPVLQDHSANNPSGGDFKNLLQIDLDADGDTEFLQLWESFSNRYADSNSDNDGLGAPWVYSNTGHTRSGLRELNWANQTWSLDFDGDGDTDIIYFGYDENRENHGFHALRNDGSGSFQYSIVNMPLSSKPYCDPPRGITGAIADYDGDRRAEFIYNDCRYVSRWYALHYVSPASWDTSELPLPREEGALLPADLNGDGNPDLIYEPYDFPDGCPEVWFGTGDRTNGFVLPPNPPSYCGETLFDKAWESAVAIDFTGDGDDEIIVPVHIGGPIGVLGFLDWSKESLTQTYTELTGLQWYDADLDRGRPELFVADFNRDGLDDLIIGDNPLTGDRWRIFKRSGDVPDLLVGIRTGHDPRGSDVTPSVEIKYDYGLHNSVWYEPLFDSECPTDSICKGHRRMIVSRTVDRRASPISQRQYKYEGAVTHRKGRGWLGYKVVSWEDKFGYSNNAQRASETFDFTYDVPSRNFPYRHFPAKTTFEIETDENVKFWQDTEVLQWEMKRPLGSHFAVAKQVQVTSGTGSRDVGQTGATTITRDYDDYANPILLRETATTSASNPEIVGLLSQDAPQWLENRLDLESAGNALDTTITYYPSNTATWEIGQVEHVTINLKASACNAIENPPSDTWRPAWFTDTSCSTTVEGMNDVEYTYFPSGLLHTVTERPGSGSELISTFGYDAQGNLTSSVSEGRASHDGRVEARSMGLSYEPHERIFPMTMTNGHGHETSLVFDRALSVPVMVRDENDISAVRQIDGFGRAISGGVAGGATWTVEVAARQLENGSENGIVVTRTASTGAHSEDEVDRYGQIQSARWLAGDGREIEQRFEYDLLGRLKSISYPFERNSLVSGQVYGVGTSLEYEVANQIKRIVEPGGATEVEHRGLVSKVTLPPRTPDNSSGTSFFAVHDGLGRRIATVESDGSILQLYYGATGALWAAEDPEGNTSLVITDIYGRPEQMIDPDLGERTFDINAFGEIVYHKDQLLRETILSYDALGRLIERVDPDGTTTWTWDTGTGAGIGRIASTVSPDSQSEVNEYDEFGRLQSRLLTRTPMDGETVERRSPRRR